MKPRIRIITSRPVPIGISKQSEAETPVERARRRFGRPFAHERGTDFKRNPTPVLTRWLAKEPWKNRSSE